MAFGPNGWLSVHPICTQIDEDENFIYAPELTIKDMILTFQSMLNSHLHNPKTPKMVKIGLEQAKKDGKYEGLTGPYSALLGLNQPY